MSIKEKPHYTLSAEALAGWLDRQPEKWWSVDGDPLLSEIVDFPCPSDELAPEVRRVGKNLLLQDKTPHSQAHGEPVGEERLDELADTRIRRPQKILHLAWADSDIEWLLLEDDPMVA